MIDDWPRRALEDVAFVQMGQSPPGSTYNLSQQGLPFLQGSAEFGKHYPDPIKWCSAPANVAEPGDLMLSVRAPVGETNFADQRLAVGRGLAIIRGRDGVLTEYLRLVIQAGTSDLLERSGGSVFASITGANLRAFQVLLAPAAKQRRIVDLIGAFDNQIDAVNTEAIALRRLYDQLLFTAIYGRTGDDVPERVALRDCLDLEVNRVDVQPERTYRIIGVLNAGRGLIDRGIITGDQTGYATLNLLRRGQLVMRKLTAWEGPIAVVPELYDACYASAEFPTFTPKPDHLTSDFLSHLCRWPGLWNEMKQRVTGSVQRRKRLSPDQLLDVRVPLPSPAVQMEYSSLLDAVLESVRGLEAESESCAAVRSSALGAFLVRKVDLGNSYDDLLQGTS